MFNILDLDTKELVLDPEKGEPLVFENGKLAGIYCKFYGGNLQPRKMGTDERWREREIARFTSGDYTLPDYLHPWALPDHFLHASKDKSGMLAYTPDHLSGMADLQKRISIRGYLETFHKGLNPQIAKNLEFQHSENYKFSDGLKFAFTPEDIAKVYINFSNNAGQVSASCMRYPFDHLPMHPACVYAAGDLALAYLVDSKGATTHRSVVWPEKKLYGRIYGDTGSLYERLKKREYNPSRYYGGEFPSFEGARLLAVPIPDNDGVYLMPYVDEQNLWAALFDVADPPYLVLTRKEISKRSLHNVRYAHGATQQIRTRRTCERCHANEFDMHAVYRGRNDPDLHQVNWCNSCFSNYTFRCQGFDHIFSAEDMTQKVMADGEIWSEAYFIRHGGYTCGFNGRNYKDRTRAITVHNEVDVGSLWCPGSVKNNAWQSSYGRWYSNSVEKVVVKEENRELLWPKHRAERDAALVDGVWVTKPKPPSKMPEAMLQCVIENIAYPMPDGNINYQIWQIMQDVEPPRRR